MELDGILHADPRASILPTTQIIELELDPIKNGELGGFPPLGEFSNWEESKTVVQADLRAPSVENHEIYPLIGKSYLAFEVTTVQSLGDNKTLFVVRFHFHPSVDHRFTSATITIKFLPPNSVEDDILRPLPPKVIDHAPRKAYGGVTKEHQRRIWSLELPLTAGIGPFSASVTPGFEMEKEKEVEQSMIIRGTVRGPSRSYVVWTAEENKSSECGLPSEMQFATVVENHGPVLCKISVQARLGGGLFPWVRSKRDSSAEKGVVLDANSYGGISKNYEINGTNGWKELLDNWTGEVKTSSAFFDSPII